MLTFFRRIRKGLLEGGRTSKYLLYAIGEILLVVIVILIALQINNWNQGRLNRLEEKRILINLHREFLLNKDEVFVTKQTMEKCINAGHTVMNLMARNDIEIVKYNIDSLLFYTIENAKFAPSKMFYPIYCNQVD